MKMRVVSLILLLAMVVVMLASCSTTSEANTPNPLENRFECYSAGSYQNVFVDKVTGVCYFKVYGSGTGLTVMLNADGTPVTWEEVQHEAD